MTERTPTTKHFADFWLFFQQKGVALPAAVIFYIFIYNYMQVSYIFYNRAHADYT